MTSAQPDSSFNLTTEDGVRAYVTAAHPYLLPCTIALLSGGYVNHVWAIRPAPLTAPTAPTDARRRNLVLKYYPPHARYQESITLPQSRAQAEYNALVHIHSLAPTSGGSWSVPEPIHYDPANHLVLMSEIHEAVPLLTFLHKTDDDDATSQRRDLANLRAIAAALAHFHQTVTSQSLASIQPWFVNTDMAAFFTHRRDFSSTAQRHALPNAQAWIDRALGPRGFAHANQSLIFGDFWPNSVLVHLSPRVAAGEPIVSIIDWECHRPGHAGEDVAQMCANLFIMLHGEPYDHDAVKVVLDEFVNTVKSGAKGPDVFPAEAEYDVEAMMVRQVTNLVQVPHWGISDDKQVVRKAAEGGVKKVLGL
ncbi:kinase-like domain-containing protein [Catenaria anguillulae PL171]|uniref:Kinase-like domain-containing protein n=1 Tax=Catenaria anguillulae PL171 TaxID=765915 RepID=A0A1Y2HDP8_9FUNG|nr:kinase-like domain-containing protein [Catenaria anguillulae PL171]